MWNKWRVNLPDSEKDFRYTSQSLEMSVNFNKTAFQFFANLRLRGYLKNHGFPPFLYKMWIDP